MTDDYDPAAWHERAERRSRRAHWAALLAFAASIVLTRAVGVVVDCYHEAEEDQRDAAAAASILADARANPRPPRSSGKTGR